MKCHDSQNQYRMVNSQRNLQPLQCCKKIYETPKFGNNDNTYFYKTFRISHIPPFFPRIYEDPPSPHSSIIQDRLCANFHTMSFLAEKHANYFRLCLKSMPAKAQSEDSNKLALIYFTVHCLALLGRLEQEIDREAAVADIYAYLIPSYDGEISGFRSSQTFALDEKNADYDLPNLLATFFALATLLAFEEDFSKKLDRDRIMRFVSRCQIKEGENKGSFRPVIDPEGQPWGGSDLRLCYIAAGIRKMLGYDKLANRPFDIDVSSLEAFILDKVNFNGGLSSSSHTESHSGLTFCGIAALRLLGTDLLAPKHSEWVELTKQWLVHRQVDYPAGLYKGTSYEYYQECDIGGFNGRENKFADTCYLWWVVGLLNLLSEDGVGLINDQGLLDYLLDRTQHKLIGGFAKDTEAFPDPFHSFLAVCSVSLLKHSLHLSIEGSDVLEPVDGELVISHRLRNFLDHIWR